MSIPINANDVAGTTGYDPNGGGANPSGTAVTGIMTPNPNAPQPTIGGSATAPSYMPATPDTGTGLQPGNGAGINGVDLTQPGTGENVSASYLDYYKANGTPTTSNNAQSTYDSFAASQPANMNPYYDNAQRNSDNAINKQMAARGQYGSSNAIGVLSNADTNLRAQQAKDEAQYGLSRYQLQGGLGSAADASSATQSQNDLNWMQGISALGFQNQKESTARSQLGFQNQLTGAGIMSGIEGKVGGDEIANDKAALDQLLLTQSGASADAIAAAEAKLAQDTATSNNNTSQTTGAIQNGIAAAAAKIAQDKATSNNNTSQDSALGGYV